MALTIGTRLGSHEVTGLLGKGGMGEVYRARDLKLKREVAIKILPDEFSRDADRVNRFQREAEVLASLNHPNIAGIYDLQHTGATLFLVMELIEGETLADRIKRGLLPVEEALEIGKRVCEALEAAHEKSIIHRDLKPANIKITPDDKVKVLDFGLAKIFRDGAENPALSNSPTIMSGASIPGLILGTAAYMSPEQARGKSVDKRTDIWAFGVVLFEMLTGRSVFEGETLTDILGAIVHKEPDWTKLPAGTPGAVLRLLRRCLTKDPRQRLHDIADARIEIESVLREPEPPSLIPARKPKRKLRIVVPVAVLAVGLVIGALASWWSLSGSTSSRTSLRNAPGPSAHTVIDLPPNALLSLGTHIPAEGFDNPVLALSPDGKYLAYVSQSAQETMLYLREMASTEVRPLPGTEGALHPFFSPDGQWIGFLTDNQVKKVSVHGGAVKTLCEAARSVQAWWPESDTIYFTESAQYSLFRVSANGGKPLIAVTEDDIGKAVNTLGRITDVLPGAQSLIVTATRNLSSDYSDIEVFSIVTWKAKPIIQSGYGAHFVQPGYLVFARAASLWAVPFDPVRLELRGEPLPVAVGVSMESLFGQVHATFSATGLLAYVPGGDRAIGKPAWVGRKGSVEFLDVPQRAYGVLDLSPNGRRLSIEVADVTDYIWIYDIDRHEGRRLYSTEPIGQPAWAPDSTRLSYASFAAPLPVTVKVRDVDAASPEVEILKDAVRPRWSPDGRILAIGKIVTPDAGTVFVSAVDQKTESTIKSSDTHIDFVDFSPDGRWFAYSGTQSGQSEVWIRSYPDGKTSRQISTDGGIEPVWCPCGGNSELFYRKGNRWFSTKVATTPELRWDPPRVVFQTDFIDTPGLSYDVSPDGQRLLVVKRAEPDIQNKIHVITNWYQALERKTPN